MTKQEAAIVAAYTGFLIGEFSEMHKYIEKIMDRPVWTHELSNKDTMKQIREKAKPDFIGITVND